METVYKIIKLLVATLLLLPLLWAASCSMLFGGAAYAVKEAVVPIQHESENSRRAEARRHQDELDREAGFAPSRHSSRGEDYEKDY
ncbi:MAG: hypothetical protein ACKOUT_13100 [Novosphingobium sp.]